VCARADATARVRRKKAGGNSGKKFTEGCAPRGTARASRLRTRCGGRNRVLTPPLCSPRLAVARSWVEFADKKVAKRTAAILNGQQIGACSGASQRLRVMRRERANPR
jgi:hypothetical protein